MSRKSRRKQPDRARTPAAITPPAAPVSGRATAVDGVLFALPVLLVALFGIHSLTSIYQDIGRHLRLGEMIWRTHRIPDTNLFSFTHPDFPFINHHWLGEVILYGGDRAFGLSGLIVVKALLLAAAFGLAYAAAWRPRVSASAMIVALVSLLVFIERTDVRPEILSFVFVGWFLFVLYGRPGLSWTLPIVQLVWVNTHIYFFMGPFLWVAWLCGEIARTGDWKSVLARRPVVLTGAVAAATLCNPHFLDGALYPLRVMGNYGYSVAENQTAWFMRQMGYSQLTTVMLTIGVLVTVATFALNRRNIRSNVFGAITCIVTAVLAFMMIRNFPLFALAMLPANIRNLSDANITLAPLRLWLPVPAVALGVLVVTNQIYVRAHMDRAFGLSVPAGHQRAVDHFRRIGIKGPIFNNFDIGSFLIWKLPEIPVFIDGRPEAYPADFIRNVYIPMQQDPAVWARESARHNLNAIIWNANDGTPWSQAFIARITADPEWTVMFFGDRVLILLKNTEANMPIIERNPPVILPG